MYTSTIELIRNTRRIQPAQDSPASPQAAEPSDLPGGNTQTQEPTATQMVSGSAVQIALRGTIRLFSQLALQTMHSRTRPYITGPPCGLANNKAKWRASKQPCCGPRATASTHRGPSLFLKNRNFSPHVLREQRIWRPLAADSGMAVTLSFGTAKHEQEGTDRVATLQPGDCLDLPLISRIQRLISKEENSYFGG